jgi:hypothetical protein
VLLIVATTKTAEGAWIIIVMIPVLVTIFEITRRHYDRVASELSLNGWSPDTQGNHVVIVPIGGIQRAVVKALRYARRSATMCARLLRRDRSRRHPVSAADVAGMGAAGRPRRARVAVSIVDGAAARLHRRGAAQERGYLCHSHPARVRPTAVVQHLLHNQHALLIKGALFFKRNIVVTSVPYHLGWQAEAVRATRQVVAERTDPAL